MSADVQPRKRKDKKKKKDEDDVTQTPGVHAGVMGQDDVHLHIQKDHGTGGHWCAKIVFFSLLAILLGLIGLIILEKRGLTDLETAPAESRYSEYFNGWVEDSIDMHDEHDHHEEDHDVTDKDHSEENHSGENHSGENHSEENHSEEDSKEIDADAKSEEDEEDEGISNEMEKSNETETEDEIDSNSEEVQEEEVRRVKRGVIEREISNEHEDDEEDEENESKSHEVLEEEVKRVKRGVIEREISNEQEDDEEDEGIENKSNEVQEEEVQRVKRGVVERESSEEEREEEDEDDEGFVEVKTGKLTINDEDESSNDKEEKESESEQDDDAPFEELEDDGSLEDELVTENDSGEDLHLERLSKKNEAEETTEEPEEISTSLGVKIIVGLALVIVAHLVLVKKSTTHDDDDAIDKEKFNENTQEEIQMKRRLTIVTPEDQVDFDDQNDEEYCDEEEEEGELDGEEEEEDEEYSDEEEGEEPTFEQVNALYNIQKDNKSEKMIPTKVEPKVEPKIQPRIEPVKLSPPKSSVPPKGEEHWKTIPSRSSVVAPQIEDPWKSTPSRSPVPPPKTEDPWKSMPSRSPVPPPKTEDPWKSMPSRIPIQPTKTEEPVRESKIEPVKSVPTRIPTQISKIEEPVRNEPIKPPRANAQSSKNVESKLESKIPIAETKIPFQSKAPIAQAPIEMEYDDEDDEDIDDDIDDDDIEEYSDEEEDISDVDDTDLMKRLDAKYGKLPETPTTPTTADDDSSWTKIPVRDGSGAQETQDDLRRANRMLNDNPKSALKLFESILKKDPFNTEGLLGKAQALDRLAAKKQSNLLLDEAIETYKKLLRMDDKLVDDDIFKVAGERCIDRMRFKGQHLKAIEIHEALIKRFNDEPNYRNQLAITYLLVNRLLEAKYVLHETLLRWRHNGVALVHYGFVLKLLDKNMVRAAQFLREGIETGEDGTQDGRFYFSLGEALTRSGQTDEALEVYKLGAKKKLFLSLYQRSLYNIDRLKSHPFWTKKKTTYEKHFQILEQNWERIRDEGLNVLSQKGYFQNESEDLRDVGDWKQFDLFAQGQKRVKNCEKTPFTCKVIEMFSAARFCKRGQVKFSVMHPGTHIWPHCGPTNCRIRAHLGLKVPTGTYIRVANETRTWENGKFLIFDDSFEHEVWHNGTSVRLILIIDVWHPDLTNEDWQMLEPI